MMKLILVVVFLTELLRRYLTNLKEKFIAAQHEE
jgi:hypothetical protein